MKIDKVIFASSEDEYYSSFWNMQSKLWKVGLGIEPICLLYGKKENTDMTEEHGKIIEMEYLPDLPKILQLTWSKFNYPTLEPDTTWIMGDIDMLPLSKRFFTEFIADIPDSAFAHLNASGNVYDGDCAKFFKYGSQIDSKLNGRRPGGVDLPGHYWTGKGKRFEIFTEGKPFEKQVDQIVKADLYGLGPTKSPSYNSANPASYYWCAEEMRSSELMYDAIKNGQVTYVPRYYTSNQRIDRSTWAYDDYGYHAERLAQKLYVDIHCVRPYKRQKDACERIIEISGILK